MEHRLKNYVVCLFALLALGSGAAQAQTHLGVPSQDLVILSGDGFTYNPGSGSILGPGDFPNALLFTTRHLPDGTEVENFEIPDGKVLVVTEITLAYRGSQSNHTYCLPLYIGTSDPPAGSNPIVSESCMLVDADRIGSISESFTTGFVVNRNERLYTIGPWDPHNGGPDSGGEYMGRPDGSSVLVRGYLADRRPGPGRAPGR